MSYLGFFNDSAYQVVDGNIVYASDLNSPMAALETGIASLVDCIQTGATIKTATDTGVVNAYVMSLTAAPVALTDGLEVWLKPTVTNTGAATLNLNSLGAKAIRSTDRTALVGGELLAGYSFLLKYIASVDAWLIVSNPGRTALDTSKTIAGGDCIEITSDSTTITISVPDGSIGQEKLSFDSLPPGAVVALAMSAVPGGFLECDGAAVSRTTYVDLFAAISDDYGAGDGSTTFNLPDYRGRFLRGWAHGQATDPDKASRTDRGDGTGGDVVGSKQADEFKAHTHGSFTALGPNYTPNGGGATTSSSVAAVSAGGSETRPVNTNVMFCIKY